MIVQGDLIPVLGGAADAMAPTQAGAR